MHVTVHLRDGVPYAVTHRRRDGVRKISALEGTTLRQWIALMRGMGFDRRVLRHAGRPFGIDGNPVSSLRGITSCHWYSDA